MTDAREVVVHLLVEARDARHEVAQGDDAGEEDDHDEDLAPGRRGRERAVADGREDREREVERPDPVPVAVLELRRALGVEVRAVAAAAARRRHRERVDHVRVVRLRDVVLGPHAGELYAGVHRAAELLGRLDGLERRRRAGREHEEEDDGLAEGDADVPEGVAVVLGHLEWALVLLEARGARSLLERRLLLPIPVIHPAAHRLTKNAFCFH